MRVVPMSTDDTNLFIDECENASALLSKQDVNSKLSPDSEPIYAEIVKAMRPKKLSIEKPSLKRASWSPAEHQECGLPPTGKRTNGDSKSPNRVRMRSRPIRNYQLQQPYHTSGLRPISFNERFERLPNHILNRNGSLSNQRRQPADTLIQITKHTSPPSCDKNDTSSSTTPQHTNPPIATTTTTTTTTKRPLFGTYQQKDSDYKLSSPNLNPNTVPLSSPISSSASITCQKGQEELSPSPKGSSLNQYHELTSQTESIDLSRDVSCHPTTRRLMTMSISPNRLHNQTHSSITNITNGLKQQEGQTNSRINNINSCLKSNRPSRIKKSVHFDWHPPIEIQSTSDHYHPSVTVTSPNDNNEEKKSNNGETVKEQERRTTSPLTTHIIHRSFSLSPSPFNKEENNRRHRQQVKKVNVDELNCTTNRRVTFNNNISPTEKSNGISENLTHPMPSNTLVIKTSSFNSSKCSNSNSFLNFLNRTNPKALAIQRKSKRLSADVESLSKRDIIDKVTINHQNTKDNNIDSSNPINRSSITMSTKTNKSDEDDSINNAFLFQPQVQSIKQEPFYLSPPKSTDDSSMGMMMQTSTLIISTPPQYHYYLYPPAIGKKNSTTNISMNSISTNSSSSSTSSYDLDEDTFSYSNYPVNNRKQVQPVVLSDSVQNFWPPPPSPSTLNNDPEQIIAEQNKQSQSNQQQNTFISSTYNDDSLSVGSGNQTDVLPPTTSLMLNTKEEEVRSYSEQSSFGNRCLRIGSDSSFEDTQASYSERLREKSRSIKQPVAMNVNNYSLSRSRSKDNVNQQSNNNLNSINRTTLRPKSAGQVRAQVLLSPLRQEISNDFQSKRQFFENRTYTDYAPPSTSTTNNRIYTNSPTNHPQRHVTKCSWNDSSSRQPLLPPQTESTIRTTKYFDSVSNQVSVPPTVYRKPIRIVKAVQRSAPSPTNNDVKFSYPNKTSSQYIRNLFPAPDRSRQNSETMSNGNIQPTDDLNKRLEILRDNQRILNDKIEINTLLGAKLMKIIESKAEPNEIEKLKLHINEIETITSVLLKLSCRLAKVENDLSTITDENAHTKANLLEQREKIQQKHDEAKTLKDGIDRRSRLVTNILRKYLSDEQFDDYEYFIRMKSTLLMDAKDVEENILYYQKLLRSPLNHVEHLQTNYCKSISTTA